MDKIARICAEIERRKSVLTQHSKLTCDLILEAFIKEYDDLLSFIDTLSEEPSKDLGEEIEMEWDSFNKHLAEYDDECQDVVWLNWFSFEDIARHFYELGKQAKKEK